jgi:hypothetical protein
MKLVLPLGAAVHLGRPAKPMDASLVEALAALVGSFAEVQEAHLPQFWVPSIMSVATQVLAVAFSSQCGEIEIEEVARRIEKGVSGLLPRKAHLDIWCITPDNSLLDPIRSAGCKIFARYEPRSEYVTK